jgi:hypothetical protein
MICIFRKCYSGDKINNNEMGGAYGTDSGKEEMHTGFWWGNQRQRKLEQVFIDRRIILK